MQALRAAQSDLIAARDRLQSLENQLGSGRGNKNDIQLREQITERNTLLLTVYQYMDKFGAPVRTTVDLSTHSLLTFGCYFFLAKSWTS